MAARPRYPGPWAPKFLFVGGLLAPHKLHKQCTTLDSSKMGIFRFFFDILTIRNDQISYVKHVIHPLHVFFTVFGCLDGGKRQGHNLLVQFSTLGSPKMEISETVFLLTFRPFTMIKYPM